MDIHAHHEGVDSLKDSKLLHQIDAGIKGRRKGHSYENELARRANKLAMPYVPMDKRNNVVHNGAPEIIMLDKVLAYLNWDHCDQLEAYATGKPATSEKGSKEINIDGQSITSAKSDVILIELSRRYSLFAYSIYRVKKGRFKEPEGVSHQAPRFGVIQMQRGGQKQHPTQLQFNLKAGYFYELDKQ